MITVLTWGTFCAYVPPGGIPNIFVWPVSFHHRQLLLRTSLPFYSNHLQLNTQTRKTNYNCCVFR